MMSLKVEEIAWAAGFFDGEGCILPDYRRRGHYVLRVTVRQVDRAPLDWMKEAFGGSIEAENKSSELRNPIFRWVLEARKAREFLCLVKPYLRVKGKHPYFSTAETA